MGLEGPSVLVDNAPVAEPTPAFDTGAVLGGLASMTAVAVPGKADKRRASAPPPERSKVQRELRHVALVHLCMHGLDELAMDLGAGALAQARDGARKILEGIAWKRGARWSWDEDERTARAVVGLTADPSGAPFEAAALALDVHDALADLSTDLPIGLSAAVGIVRAVASGERDEGGHLLRHQVQGSAASLGDALAAASPPGRTWVAGGLYRLVRREFQWGDAPTLELGGPASEGEQPLPKNMRVYALVRALTREERHAELAIAAGELVGRDVERADLQAAYHRAVVGPEVVSRLIVGEMGIGKTALVASFLRDLPPDARAVRLECAPSHAELPYAAIGELVRDACALDPAPSRSPRRPRPSPASSVRSPKAPPRPARSSASPRSPPVGRPRAAAKRTRASAARCSSRACGGCSRRWPREARSSSSSRACSGPTSRASS